MDWLREADGELERRRKQEEARREASRLKAEKFKAEADKVGPMVFRLLNDLGVFWYGTRWFKQTFVIQTGPVGLWKLGSAKTLELQGSREVKSYTGVRLETEPSPHFIISKHEFSNRDGDEETLIETTVDASEAELQKALRKAAIDPPVWSIRRG